MNIPEYIPRAEVQRVCQELGISDWSRMAVPQVTLDEAKIIQTAIGSEALLISVEDFRQGLEVELEHGISFPDANVTNNHPLLTGRIVLAHLKEMLDYYLRLELAELEGEMLIAAQKGDAAKVTRKYQQWVLARADLSERERKALNKKD